MKVALMSSTKGSIIQSIIEKCDFLDMVVFITNKECPALQIAKNADILSIISVSEEEILNILDEKQVDYVILAGYMKIIGPEFVTRYKNRIINTHPSLLPSFPGAVTHRKVLERGCKLSGCTIHFVDEGVDTGPIIAQSVVDVDYEDTPESLKEKVQKVERELYPKILKMINDNKIEIIDGKVKVNK